MAVLLRRPGVGTSQGRVRGGALLRNQGQGKFSDREDVLANMLACNLASQSGK